MATTSTIANAWTDITLPDIFYEDPEQGYNLMLQFPDLFRVMALLMELYEDRPDVFPSGGGFVMYNPQDGNDRVAPDFYIAFDVDRRAILENLHNFWIWEIGKAPDFVVEVGSRDTHRRDLLEKRALYQSLGVSEYWRFDPTGGDYYGQPITGERLVEGEYQPYPLRASSDGSVRVYSELLGVDFFWGEGEFDVLDPETGVTIEKREIERMGRLDAEARATAEREARFDAEAHADTEREARLDAEARERELLEEIDRLRRRNW